MKKRLRSLLNLIPDCIDNGKDTYKLALSALKFNFQ